MSDTQAIIDEIRSAHRMRNFAMDQRKRLDNAILSFLRMALGWRKDGDEQTNEDAKKRALSLVEVAEADAEVIRLLAKRAEDPDGFGKRDQKALDKAKEGASTDDPMYLTFRSVILASVGARAPYDRVESETTKEMERLAKMLPVAEWAEGVKGLGMRSLAVIIGEAGDLSAYPKKGHLWKRMGLAVIGGVRQGGLSKGAPKQDWIDHGYNRKRRSQMFVIGDVMVKVGDEYRQVYLDRKDYERARAEAAGLTVVPAAKIPKGRMDEFVSDGHIHRRAQRYMEKRLLRDLWKAWRAAEAEVDSPQLIAAE